MELKLIIKENRAISQEIMAPFIIMGCGLIIIIIVAIVIYCLVRIYSFVCNVDDIDDQEPPKNL